TILLNLKYVTMKQNTKNKNRGRQTRSVSEDGKRSKSNGNAGQGSLLEKFFIDQLQDIYYAEQQLLKAIPKMAQASTTEELEDAFNNHLRQTERHVKRLEKVFQIIGKKAEGKKCEAIEGITREADSIIKETKQDTMTRD